MVKRKYDVIVCVLLMILQPLHSQQQDLAAGIAELTHMVQALQQQVSSMQTAMATGSGCSAAGAATVKPKDCEEVLASGSNSSGVYTIYPSPLSSDPGVEVFCDMADDGAWTVIQRRMDGSENFYRSWKDYEAGFGNLTNEHWLGNKHIHTITNNKEYELKVTLTDFQSQTKTANYKSFKVKDAIDYYQLQVSGYSGTAGDSLIFDHNGHNFSTADADHDGAATVNCAQNLHGGYWYSNCFKSNINGKFGVKAQEGILWGSFKNWDLYVLKETEMKVKPASTT